MNNKILFPADKSGRVFINLIVLFSLVYLTTLTFQCISSDTTIRVIMSVIQLFACLAISVSVGKLGFLSASVFTFVSIVVSVYEALVFTKESSVYILGLALITFTLNVILQLYIQRTHAKLSELKSMYEAARAQNVALTTEHGPVNEALTRTSLIVKHTKEMDQNIAGSAIAMSCSKYFDTLTTLPNRNKLIEHLEMLIDDSISLSQSDGGINNKVDSPIYVIYISIDDYHKTAKLLGHQTMDLFIQSVAHRLRECAEPTDMVGRVTGGEFVVVVKHFFEKEELNGYITKLTDVVTNSFKSGDNIIKINTSVGVSQYPQDAHFSGELLKCAESAMCKLAVEGENTVSFWSEIAINKGIIVKSLEPEKVLKLRDDFNRALENNEFFMVYQPQFTSSRKLIGFEAFLRWNSSEFGLVSARDFMDIAERNGSIYKLGKLSLDKSLSMLNRINAINPNLKMTINLSSVELKTSNLAEEIASNINSIESRPENIEFDIPEESLIVSFDSVSYTLSKISELGISMALDNFGRGYSSLNNIPLLPISRVKLDGNFTKELKSDNANRVLTSSIISLLHEIDIEVSATGVGSEEQFVLLSRYGCDTFQGAFLCKPLSEDEAIALVSKQTFSK